MYCYSLFTHRIMKYASYLLEETSVWSLLSSLYTDEWYRGVSIEPPLLNGMAPCLLSIIEQVVKVSIITITKQILSWNSSYKEFHCFCESLFFGDQLQFACEDKW